MEAMSLEQLAQHEELSARLERQRDELMELLAGYDPYRDGFRVLDTDYDNYMMVYHCAMHEVDEEDGDTSEELSD